MESDPGHAQATILIVDDQPENLSVLGEILLPQYRVRAVSSGERALAAAVREPRPDLILLDIMMPQMDGFETLRRLRADELTCDIPVIFVTALQDEADEQRGFECGAADYIHKPVNPVVVRARVRAQLEAKAARDMLRSNNRHLVVQVAEGARALERAQQQLLQSEKMAAMGQLAAGVAHEINNPIGFVSSNLGTLENYVRDLFEIVAEFRRGADQAGTGPASAEAMALLEKLDYDFVRQDTLDLLADCREGMGRVRSIVSDLKSFARSGDHQWELADVHQGLESTLNIVWNEIKYRCTVTRNYGVLPRVRCIPSQLNQVFMNLLVNAGQAIESKGEIVITTEPSGPDAVRISIRDNGKGIAPDVLPHIFEPFYTTKPVGKGTGLGLSLVWSIIERHRGRIEVASAPGAGTTFTLTLPVDPEKQAVSH